MARIYDAQSMVLLPKLDADSGSMLVAAMLQAADQESSLTPAVMSARDAVAMAHRALTLELERALDSATNGAEITNPESHEISAWNAAEMWLSGLMSLPSTAKPPIAARVHALLFPSGMTFLRGNAAKRWAETSRRLLAIHDKQLEGDFEALGGADILEALEQAHEETGRALGFTVAGQPPEAPQVRARLDALKATLREYVLQVAASVRPVGMDGPGLAERLLKPLTEFEPPLQ